MAEMLCISVRFLQPIYNGRNDTEDPEWPPSPLRLFQAMVSASAARWNERSKLSFALPALRWLEGLPAPQIVVPKGSVPGCPYQLFVPDNTSDTLVASWKNGDFSKQVKRTEKIVRSIHLGGETLHYLYELKDGECPFLDILAQAARAMTHLGWGTDMVVADAAVISNKQGLALEGERWLPTRGQGTPLRVTLKGTVEDLVRRHDDFLRRISPDGFRPVPSLRAYQTQAYRCIGAPVQLPYRVFELRDADGARFRYPAKRLIHIAGMVRHVAITAMRLSPPPGCGEEWVDTFVAGHMREVVKEHRQISYIPIQSIGHLHTDPGVRRILIAAPPGEFAWLNHLARQLAGQMLEPVYGNEFNAAENPLLIPIRYDSVIGFYVRPSNVWASTTPVILPGHDDHKPAKTRKLIEKALAQSGLEQECDFEWSTFPRFRKMLSAHKYDRSGKPTGYIRPDHLITNTAVHLTLRFKNGTRLPGPLTIGAGRHCGLGIFAGIEEDTVTA